VVEHRAAQVSRLAGASDEEIGSMRDELLERQVGERRQPQFGREIVQANARHHVVHQGARAG